MEILDISVRLSGAIGMAFLFHAMYCFASIRVYVKPEYKKAKFFLQSFMFIFKDSLEDTGILYYNKMKRSFLLGLLLWFPVLAAIYTRHVI